MEKLLGETLYNKLKPYDFKKITEIRLRLNREIYVKTALSSFPIDFTADDELLQKIVNNATNNSRYAYEDSISQGYIDYCGGVRIGVVGAGRTSDSGRISLSDIYSICIRIPHEILGCANSVGYLSDDFKNTLVISPPGGGKTTFLRELSRILSGKYDVLVIDEREEICGKGLCMKMGIKCDVLQGVKKSLAYERAIRTMCPEIVVCDELFGKEDTEAMQKLSGAGVKILASIHSEGDVDDEILKGIFFNRIILSSKPKPGSIISIVRGTAAERGYT